MPALLPNLKSMRYGWLMLLGCVSRCDSTPKHQPKFCGRHLVGRHFASDTASLNDDKSFSERDKLTQIDRNYNHCGTAAGSKTDIFMNGRSGRKIQSAGRVAAHNHFGIARQLAS